MVKPRGLGRGLDALIPVLTEAGEELRQIEIAQIRANRLQARENWDEEGIAELAASIKEHGLLQPIVVRRIKKGYEVVAGERRWRACKLLGWQEIPALVRDYDDAKSAVALLVENVQRENLNPLEEAAAYQRLIDEFKLTQEEVARQVSKSRSAIGNALRLLTLPPAVLLLLKTGQLTAGHARALLSLHDAAAQEDLARKAAARGLSVREVEEAVKRKESGAGGNAKEAVPADEEITAAASALSRVLKKKVAFRLVRKRWRLEISFRDREEIAEFTKRVIKTGKVSRET
ncbi:MAG: ParB/RepB/Spo0J family partition protein [Bacillota bacterium]